MTGIRHRFLAIIGLTGALALGGCAYDDGYGYGGVSVGSGYYDDGYYGSSGYYQPGGYGGWYDNYYYPGSGYYIYDRGGRRHRWNDSQRRYWEGRRAERGDDGRWRGRDRDRDGRDWNGGNRDGRDRDGNWRDRDGRPGNDNATRPPRPPQGTNDGRNWGRGQNGTQGRDRSGWRGNRPDGARPTPQPGLRQPQAQPQSQPRPSRPQMSQPRPQRDWGGAGRQTRGREPTARVRPD